MVREPAPGKQRNESFPMKRLILALMICAAGLFRLKAGEATNLPPSLTLAQAQAMALKNHPQIAAANYRALAAREALKETRSGFFPRADLFADAVGANSEGTRVMAGGLNNPSIYDRAAGGVSVSQLITDFGRTANLVASSRLRAQAENQNASATREQVLLQVSSGYYGALEAQAVLHVAQQTFDTRQLLLDQVSLLASNKLKSSLDVSFASVAVQESKLLLLKAQSDADATMMSLSTALGFAEPQQFQLIEDSQPDLSLSTNVADLVASALAERPELLSLRNDRDAALRYARSERDARLPTVSAVGVAGDAPEHNSHLPDDYAAGGIQLSVPMFAGGYYRARQREAELRAQSDQETLRSAEDNIVRDVHLAWLSLNNAVAQLETTRELVRNAAEAYDLAEARYKNASSSIVELSEAQLNLTSAQIAMAGARYGVLLEKANLDYQTGSLR